MKLEDQMDRETQFHADTPDKVKDVLNAARFDGTRIKVCYGYTEDDKNGNKAGQDWSERYGVTGYVGRSTGIKPVLLLCYNSRSMGGGAILDHCIVRIMHANKRNGGDLYRHPKYHQLPDHERG